MINQNLILTEKAIKNHSKRLQKELKNLNQNLTLGETQNLFAKSLGFNNFHELKKVINQEGLKSSSLTIEDKLWKFAEFIEHRSDFIWINHSGLASYRPHDNKEDFIDLEKQYFNPEEFQQLSSFILSKNPNYKEKFVEDSIKYPDNTPHTYIQIKRNVDDGLSRTLFVQLYLNEECLPENIKVIISYQLQNDPCSMFYEDAKDYLLKKSSSLDASIEKQDYYDQIRYYKLRENEKTLLNEKQLLLFEICEKGDLEDLQSYINTYGTNDINHNLNRENRENRPNTPIEFALSFNRFNIVEYLIKKSKDLTIDLRGTDDYLLRACCLAGTREHFKLVKKLFEYADISINNSLAKNLIDFSYSKNVELGKFLEKKLKF